MSVYKYKRYEIEAKESQREAIGHQESKPGCTRQSPIAPLNLEQLILRMIKGLTKLMTALRFQLHRLGSSSKVSPVSIPWFKLGLAALAFFILSQKNVQLSFNIKAPFSAFSDEEQHSDEQMGIAQSIAFRQNGQSMDIPATIVDQAPSYIRRFSKVARAEHAKYGIPASIKMAQAILGSHAGIKTEKEGGNNHFGAPMSGQAYESAWANWRAHSIHIARNYPSLFQHGDRIEDWAEALVLSDYSKDSNYGSKLLQIIERFELRQLDE